MYQLYLASQSPRRKELLKSRALFFKELHSKVSEIPNENLNILERILAIARQKLEAVLSENSNLLGTKPLILVADTEVVLNNKTFGKPLDQGMAKKFLEHLSGKSHLVITGVLLFDCFVQKEFQLVSQTEIFFKNLSEKEILEYLNTNEWQDKAGGYAIQGSARNFVTQIHGSLENVIGLPVDELVLLIKKNGWDLLKEQITGI